MVEICKLILNFIEQCKRLRIANIILKSKQTKDMENLHSLFQDLLQRYNNNVNMVLAKGTYADQKNGIEFRK